MSGREIKFRAWNVNTKRMAQWEEVRDEYGFEHLLDNDITIPMQFTGLHDKSGKEIYDGDVIRTFSRSVTPVYYDEGAFRTGAIGGALDAFNAERMEVIGNRFENPELLGKEASE